MRLKKDEKELLEIKQIKNIESIKLEDIYQPIVNGKRYLVPGFIITYGEPSKIVFWTTQDKYFEEFVRKVKEVYLEEKDQVIREGIMGKEYIRIDPLSKNILLNGNLEKLEGLYEHYKGQEGYNESLLFEEDHLKAKTSIIEYHLQEVAKRIGLSIGKIKISNGMNGCYYITTTIQKKPVILPVYYEEDKDNWSIDIGNVLEDAIPIHMEGNFTKEGINVFCTIQEYDYYNYTSYILKRGKMVQEREIHYNGNLVHWKEDDLPKCKEPEESKIAEIDGKHQLTWYALPWNGFYGVKQEDKCLEEDGTLTDRDGSERMITTSQVYISPNKQSIFAKEQQEKRYKRKIDDRMISQSILLDRINKTTIGIQRGENMLIETTFDSNGPNGFYQEHLAGQYFYQVSDCFLTEGTRRFIGKEDQVEEKTDLLDEKIYRKENR